MAKHSDDTARKKGKGSQIFVFALLAMLVLGLGGFGITNFSGGTTAIGTVGHRDITVNRYVRALQSELNAFSAQSGQPVPLAQALAMGLDRQVLQSLIAQTAMDNEADRIGLSVGDETVAAEVTRAPAFQGAAGSFDRETYRFALDRANMTEAEFEANLRADLARQLFTGAIAGGFVAPAAVTDTFHAYIAERRGFTLLRLTEADLPAPVDDPSDEVLRAFYTDAIARFTAPEAKRITFAALLPEAIAADQPVDDAALRALYEDRISDFVQPEKRLVERLVFPSQEAAEAAKARLDAGETFETLVAERNLTLEDIDLGDVTKADLGPAGDAVFALAGPDVVGPLPSDFGPALFRMNAVLAAQKISFDDARPDLALEIQGDAARRAIADQVEAIDDALAGGATLEDLVRDHGMTLGVIDFVADDPAPEGIAAYPQFRTAAAAIQEGDFPEAVLLDDGGVVALRLEEIVPPTPIPFDTARADVLSAWRADATARALSDRAIEIKAAVEGGAPLSAFGILERTARISRDGFVEGAPAGLLPAVFAMQPGEVRVIEGPGFTSLVRLDEVNPADPEGEDAAALKGAIAAQVQQAIAQDALVLYSNALTAEAGISLDQTTINAVHAQFN